MDKPVLTAGFRANERHEPGPETVNARKKGREALLPELDVRPCRSGACDDRGFVSAGRDLFETEVGDGRVGKKGVGDLAGRQRTGRRFHHLLKATGNFQTARRAPTATR